VSLSLIRTVRTALADPHTIPGRLAAAHRALEVLETAVHDLAFLDPDPPLLFWTTVHGDAVRARAALAGARSLPSLGRRPPATVALGAEEPAMVIAALLELAEALVLHLVEAANATRHDGDKACCLHAALITHELTTSLRIASHEHR
jgi:hypothetical protein